MNVQKHVVPLPLAVTVCFVQNCSGSSGRHGDAACAALDSGAWTSVTRGAGEGEWGPGCAVQGGAASSLLLLPGLCSSITG